MEHKFGINELTAIGNYATYNAAININVASFNVHDVAMAVQIALQSDDLRQQVGEAVQAMEKVQADHALELKAVNKRATEADALINELKGDVRNAEAHSEDLKGKLDERQEEFKNAIADRDKFRNLSTHHYENMEFVRELFNVPGDVADENVRQVIGDKLRLIRKTRDDHMKASSFWYDAFKACHEAVGGDKVVDVNSLNDDEFVELVAESIKAVVIRAGLKRDESQNVAATKLCEALGIDVGTEIGAAIMEAEQIREQATRYVNQENTWLRNYNELCNIIGVKSTVHDMVIAEVKKAQASREKQENYQRKYNELKGALGMSGIPHDEAVQLASGK